jgi:hypothetical protein
MIAPWAQAAIISVASILASSGFWAFVQKRDATKHATTRLLMGLAYEKIAQVGLSYIDRGWISKDEYEDFRKYLYEPYRELGGNGVAERIMLEVSGLPLRSHGKYPVKVKTRNKETDDDASFG